MSEEKTEREPRKSERVPSSDSDSSKPKARSRGHRWGRRLTILILLLLVCATISYFVTAPLIARDLVRDRSRSDAPGAPSEVTETFRVSRPGDVSLDVWRISARIPKPENAVSLLMVLHGISDQKSTMLALAERFADAGVEVALVDLRGHGASSPSRITYGVRERRDLVAVLDALEQRGADVSNVGVYGPSYGGVVALQFAGVEPRVTRVTSVAAFSSFREMLRAATYSEWLKPMPEFLIDGIVDRAGLEGSFAPDQASPMDLAARSEADIRIVHSEADEIVPFEHAQRIADTCAHCTLVRGEGDSHLGSLSNYPLRALIHEQFVGEPYEGQ